MAPEAYGQSPDRMAEYLSRLIDRLLPDVDSQKEPERIFWELIDSNEFPEIFSDVTYQILSSKFSSAVFKMRGEMKSVADVDAKQQIVSKYLEQFITENKGIFVTQKMFMEGLLHADEVLTVLAAIGRLPQAHRHQDWEKNAAYLHVAHGVSLAMQTGKLQSGPSEPRGARYVGPTLEELGKGNYMAIQGRIRDAAGVGGTKIDSPKPTRAISAEVRQALEALLPAAEQLKELEQEDEEGAK